MIMMALQSTVFISFQNGLGNEELIAELMGEDRVLGGLTAQGANIEVTMSMSSSHHYHHLIKLPGSGPHPSPHRADHLGGGDGRPGQ